MTVSHFTFRATLALSLLGTLTLAQAVVAHTPQQNTWTVPVKAAQTGKLKAQGLLSTNQPVQVVSQAVTTPTTPSAAQPATPQTSNPQSGNSQSTTSQPASTPAAPPHAVTAAQPKKPSKPQLLTVRLEASFPALVAGKKTTLPYRETLLISPERVAAAQAAGKLSNDTLTVFNDFLKRTTGPAQDARFEQQDDGSWAIVQHNALSLDADAARAALSKAVLSNEKLLLLSPKTVGSSKRTLDFFVSKGITSFLATGQTNYAGSSKERMTNIHAGAKYFKDRLFEGKTFSFNKFIGDISEERGYVPGLVIAGERTASGIGGGICQVSSTAFRALYGAGLNIVERRNHSYQVHYYSPLGLDATIYQPSQDLRFTNNAGALWFQADWDDKTSTLAIQVFGKPHDFEVKVSEPRILKTTPAPADKTIVDKTLKPGERKQVDWAAEGAVVEIDRTFWRNGKVFQKDTLKSNYKPWPNIFAVGK